MGQHMLAPCTPLPSCSVANESMFTTRAFARSESQSCQLVTRLTSAQSRHSRGETRSAVLTLGEPCLLYGPFPANAHPPGLGLSSPVTPIMARWVRFLLSSPALDVRLMTALLSALRTALRTKRAERSAIGGAPCVPNPADVSRATVCKMLLEKKCVVAGAAAHPSMDVRAPRTETRRCAHRGERIFTPRK